MTHTLETLKLNEPLPLPKPERPALDPGFVETVLRNDTDALNRLVDRIMETKR